VFYMGVVIVDQDVAHVAIVVYICCKRLFQLFHMFFICMLQVCLFRCYICFTHMLQVFYLDVAYVLQWFFQVFSRIFCKYFRHMFQVFHLSSDTCCKMFYLDVSQANQVLHLPPRFLLPRLGVSSSSRPRVNQRETAWETATGVGIHPVCLDFISRMLVSIQHLECGG
jgi:hypothetical protein